MSTRFLAPSALFMALVLSGPALAQNTITVSTSAGLQQAIDSIAEGGTIVVKPGTYYAPAAAPPNTNQGGWHINYKGKSFTIKAETSGTVVLDGEGAKTLFSMYSDPNVAVGRPITFVGLSFYRGRSVSNNEGGAVTIVSSQATFVDCTFQSNTTTTIAGGGAVILAGPGSTAFFVGAIFTANSSTVQGGALEVAAGTRAYVHNSSFVDNTTSVSGQAATTGAGGAIHVANGTLRVTNTLFDGNRAGYVGGAVYGIGTWGQPGGDIKIANSTFRNNVAARFSTPPAGSPPTEGGAVHGEDQTTVAIYSSRFDTNRADTGGAVNTYRAVVTIADSAFLGNVAVGAGSGNGFGGSISAISNDGPADSANRRSASITVTDSYLQGSVPGQSVFPQVGGCAYVAGDTNRQYGLNGVAQSGTASTNRAVAVFTRTAFRDCDVQQNPGAVGSGVGGGVLADLADLSLSDSLVVQSDAFAGAGSTGDGTAGGGLAILNQSNATITNTYLAANTVLKYGGALFVQGSTVNVNASHLVANVAPVSGYGSAVFTTPDVGRSLAVTGSVQNSVIVANTGSISIFDDDRNQQGVPINAVTYVGNQIRAASGVLVYLDSLTSATDVNGLNALVVTRTGSSTDKGQGNTAPGSDPVTGKVLAVPSRRLATGAPGDLASPSDRTPAYVAFGWSGAASASVNGTTATGNAGARVVDVPGTQTMTVSTSTFSDSAPDYLPTASTFSAVPSTLPAGGQTQLSWVSPATGFLEGAIDQGVGVVTPASGSTPATPFGPTTYRYFAMSQSGGEVVEAAVTTTGVSPTAPQISFTADRVLAWPGEGVTLSWTVQNATSVTLDGGAVGVSGSRVVGPTALTTYTLAATGPGGSSSAAVTIHVRDGVVGFGAPGVISPVNGETISVSGVTFTWTAVGGADGYGLRIIRRSTGQTVFLGSLNGFGSTSTLVSLQNGDYTFLVRGCVGGFGAGSCGPWGTADFQVRLAAPTAAPSVTAPTAGQVYTTSTNQFAWTAVAGALSYEVVVTDAISGRTASQITVPAPELTTTMTLPGGTYQIVVRACTSACGPPSAARTFYLSLPPAPTAAPRITGALLNGNLLTVQWTTVAGADLYQVSVIQSGTGPGGGDLTVASRQTAATSATFPIPPGPAVIIARACTGNGCGPFGGTVAINSIATPPSAPQIGSPMAGTVVAGPEVFFSWSRIPGDCRLVNPSCTPNVTYRLYVQDLSRQSAGLNVLTTENFYQAYFKAEGSRYDALVIAYPASGGQVQGPALGFNVAGTSATAPTMVAPAHNSTVATGNVQLGWSPVPGATLYQYYVAILGQPFATVQGVTTGLFVQVPLTAATTYSGIVRACPAGATCLPDSDAGWGPWSVNAGPGVTNFTAVP